MQAKAMVFGRGAAVAAAAGAFVLGALLPDHCTASPGWRGTCCSRTTSSSGASSSSPSCSCWSPALAGFLAYKAFKKAQSPVPDQALAAARATQATIQDETALMKEQVREVVVHPEDHRS